MKLSDFFKKDLVFTNVKVKSRDEYFTNLSARALELGFVNDEFEVNVKKREENFPTGIQLEGYGIAIPHTDSAYVNKEFIAVTTFEDEVIFQAMEDKSIDVNVKIAFMLGLRKSENQLEVLQQLMGIFQDGEKVDRIKEAKSDEELYEILKTL